MVFHFNLQCHLVVINKDRTRARQEAVCWSVTQQPGQKRREGRVCLSFPPHRGWAREWAQELPFKSTSHSPWKPHAA